MPLIVVGKPSQTLVFDDGVFNVNLTPQSYLWREPFPDRYIQTKRIAVGEYVLETFLAWIIQSHVCTQLQKPVLPYSFSFECIDWHITSKALVFIATKTVGKTDIKSKIHIAATSRPRCRTGIHGVTA